MTMNIRPKPSPRRRNPLPHGVGWSGGATAASVEPEFGRFRVLLRRRQLLADGVPVELGTRAFDLLLALLEADGSLVAKEELMSRVWPGTVVSEDNLKFQVSALRKALGADRDLVQTEFGRGYRFIGVLRVNDATAAPDCLGRERLRSATTLPSPASGGGLGRGPHSCRRSFQSVNWAACTERGRFSGLDTIKG
jgi:DNA-binding winged helix-turn-helix (wHTH) protein